MFQRIVWYLGLRTEADAVEFPCSKHKPINHKILIFKPLEFQKVFSSRCKKALYDRILIHEKWKIFSQTKTIHSKWDLIIASITSEVKNS